MRTFFSFLFWVGVFYGLDLLKDAFGFSSGVALLFLILIAGTAHIWDAVFTKRTEIITVANKAVLVKKFGKQKIVKTTDGRVFMNVNDWLIKMNSKEIDKKLKEGHTYRIVSYASDFGKERIILYATEVKASVRKKSGKK
ncbi:MAG: hypothetical protein IJD52_02920 [Alphaproteobacteria bacterium]|nr:hypothetical protein [Alphaproteobacteria bacterium]